MSAQPELMTLRLEVVGSVAVVTLAGECDMSEAPRLAAALRQAGERAGVVQVDLSDLDFLDSSGLHVLYRASSELAAMRSRLVLVSPTDAIRRVLQIAGSRIISRSASLWKTWLYPMTANRRRKRAHPTATALAGRCLPRSEREQQR